MTHCAHQKCRQGRAECTHKACGTDAGHPITVCGPYRARRQRRWLPFFLVGALLAGAFFIYRA
jgi:hypothetical protein